MAGVRYCPLGKHPDKLTTNSELHLRTLNKGCGWVGEFAIERLPSSLLKILLGLCLITCAVTFSSLLIHAEGFSHWKCLKLQCLIKSGIGVVSSNHLTEPASTVPSRITDYRSIEAKHGMLSTLVGRDWARVFWTWVSCSYKYKINYL